VTWERVIAQSTSLNLMKVHPNFVSKNDAMKEFYFSLVEFTFLQLGIEANFF
jgi:hypothetical protein